MAPIRKVAVIGGGIIGISSAVYALECVRDIEVTVIAEKFTPNTTADGSAGFWSPYLLGDVSPLVLRFWCKETFDFLEQIYKTPEASEWGVGLISCYSLSTTSMENPSYKDIFLEWREMNSKELALFPRQYRYGVFLTTFYTECTKLLPMLMKRFHTKGGKLVQKKVNDLSELCGEYDVVINCPGVEAAHLVTDSNVSPIRGQVMRVRAPWIKHAIITDGDYYILPKKLKL